MKKYLISINSNEPLKEDKLTHYGTLADYDIDDYPIAVGYQNS